MSLVNQFQISLKDYLPIRRNGHYGPSSRPTTTTVSNRLYAKLRAYADESRLPLDPVVEQLREEIHHTSAPEPEGQGFSPRAARRSASQSLRQGREDAVSAAASWFKPTDP
jgi:hypothetical protein